MPILQLNDVDLHYEVQGEGPAMLFCSATATHGEIWKFFQVPEFSRDHQVITFDQRGTGKSPFKVPLKTADFSTVRLAADAAALLDHLQARSPIVLGHSNGGRVAQQLAVDRPDLVKKLVLLSSGGESRERGLPLSMCRQMVEMGYGPYVRHHSIENGFNESYVESNPSEVERFLAVRLANPAPLEIFFRHVIGRQDFSLGARIKDIRIPALVIVGEDEDHGASGPLTHLASAKLLSENLPNAKFIVLKGQGHYYYFSDPQTLNGAIREFISSQ
jgi:pimeloyl-ACP methyl ester carboxylesterase